MSTPNKLSVLIMHVPYVQIHKSLLIIQTHERNQCNQQRRKIFYKHVRTDVFYLPLTIYYLHNFRNNWMAQKNVEVDIELKLTI